MAVPDPADESELSTRHFIFGEHPGNSKHEIHHHHPSGNGSSKIVWAWAGFTTGLVMLLISSVALYYANEQANTNERVATAVTNLSVKVGQVETKLESLDRTVDRLERTVEQQR